MADHLMHFLRNYNFLVVMYFLSRVVPNKNWGCALYECVVFIGIVIIITIHTLLLFFSLCSWWRWMRVNPPHARHIVIWTVHALWWLVTFINFQDHNLFRESYSLCYSILAVVFLVLKAHSQSASLGGRSEPYHKNCVLVIIAMFLIFNLWYWTCMCSLLIIASY